MGVSLAEIQTAKSLVAATSVRQLQQVMSVMPQVELETKHYFADGMYCRELFRPAGTLIVGKVHKQEHFYMVMKGKVLVTTDGEPKEYVGPCVIVSKPGTKRAVLALEDTTCVTVHRTEHTDLDKIEEQLVEIDPTAMFGAGNVIKHKLIGEK